MAEKNFPAAGTFDVPGDIFDFLDTEFATAIEALLAAAQDYPGGTPVSELTIASGVITPPGSGIYTVDTEGSAPTDDLTHIQYTHCKDGSLLILIPESLDRVVTIKNMQGGIGQIQLDETGGDHEMDRHCESILLVRRGSYWYELSRGGGAGEITIINEEVESLGRVFLKTVFGGITGVVAYTDGDGITSEEDSLKVYATSPESMQVNVHLGVCGIAGVVVELLSNTTLAAMTAPVANPRIDVVSIDDDGEITVTAGAEAGSPSPPATPSGELKLAEIYHRVGESAIYDTDTPGEAYITDGRSWLNWT